MDVSLKNKNQLQNKYPELEINLNKIYHNANFITDSCNKKKISVCGVVKGANGSIEIANVLIQAGCSEIGDSRLHHLIDLKKSNIKVPLLLTRIPMISEVTDLINYVDISLNSELKVIEKINEAALNNNKTHKIILMYDLGDLREGIINEDEFIETASYIESNLSNVILYGIGTNLGCYGSIKPTQYNLGYLVDISKKINFRIGRSLDIISGGATSTLPLVFNKSIPKGINHLRIGECILLARDLDTFWEININHLYHDTFILNAEIIELKNKPSYPIGEIFIDAFGEKPYYEDKGVRKRALLAVGKQDFVYHDKLIPKDSNIKIIGSSSDHLIIDLENCETNYSIGDIISFEMFYPPMLYLTESPSVYKKYI